jgi:hypothetical protein
MRKRDISGAEWARMTWDERRAALGMKKITTAGTFKPKMPRESANVSLTNQPFADTGNTNATLNCDRPVPHQHVGEVLGGFTDSQISPSDARIAAAVASAQGGDRATQVVAIQMDWKRAKERMGQQFASRPAAASNPNDLGNP